MASRAGGASDTRDYFFSLADELSARLRGQEVFTSVLRAEDSTFARFNLGRVGQAGDVRQRQLDLDLISGRRHARGSIAVSGERELDWSRAGALLSELREIVAASPEDPFLAYNTDVSRSSERTDAARLPSVDEVLEMVDHNGGDLVGIYACGAVERAFASSIGQRNWHSSQNFNFDWSLFDRAGKAVKGAYAGTEWDAARLRDKLSASARDLQLLAQPVRSVAPGNYRVFLAPAAMQELMSILSWGGFGLRDKMTKGSPFLKLHEGDAELSGAIDIGENIAGGAAPNFESSGFRRPDRVPLIAGGRFASCLVSPRSGVEYGVENNGADESEAPQAIELAAGEIDADRIAEEVHTGILVSNLWYLNFSDRPACRTTGMTRYATMWVENGRVQGPVDPMRFDDSVYRVLGDNLVGLTAQRELILDPDSYEWRSLRSALLPGALVDDFALTL